MSVLEAEPVNVADIRKERDVQVKEISERFFDTIDIKARCKDGPIILAYFMEDDPTHRDVRADLLAGVEILCGFDDSNCRLADSGTKPRDDGNRVVLYSEKSKNQLIEAEQRDGNGRIFARAYWILRSDQIPLF